jgi:hypothetical protein
MDPDFPDLLPQVVKMGSGRSVNRWNKRISSALTVAGQDMKILNIFLSQKLCSGKS